VASNRSRGNALGVRRDAGRVGGRGNHRAPNRHHAVTPAAPAGSVHRHYLDAALDHSHVFHDEDAEHDHGHGPHSHSHAHGHGHSHGLVDRSILRSRAGIRAVSISLAVLTATALIQTYLYARTLSVALLADLIHNFGDALTAIPLALAFFFRSARGERLAGLFVVFTIFVSACVALVQTLERFIHPRDLTHLWWLAAAGIIGFIGNEIAAQIRTRAGHRLHSAALIADGNHARVDGYVSLGVLCSATLVALGLNRADPLIGLAITCVILKITWDSWHTVRAGPPPGLRGP
jgi:Co/Zn/Cd efflux system component